MTEEDAKDLRRLIPQLLQVLSDIASGARDPGGADEEYRHLHREVRRILTAYGEECICPWHNAWEWFGRAARDPDWQRTLAERAQKARFLCGLDEPPPWAFEDYFRDGDPDDVPFGDEFVASLEPHKKVVLQTALDEQLAFRGTGVLEDWTAGHTMECSGARGSRTRVMMFKIRKGSDFGEVVLRVFFETASDYRLVLLHGYDKGADPSTVRERQEAKVACQRRSDLMRQRAAGIVRA